MNSVPINDSKLTVENYYFLCGATSLFLDALFLGMDKVLGDKLFQNLLDEYRNRTEFGETAFFSVATSYFKGRGYSIDDLKQAFMNSVPDNVSLLWMLEMLERLKSVPLQK